MAEHQLIQFTTPGSERSATPPCSNQAGQRRHISNSATDLEAADLEMMLMRTGCSMSLYMVIENFRNGDAVPVYRRDCGRLAPEELSYVSSWVNDKLDRCYQLMETENRALVDKWIANWIDIADFEVHPVITSSEAAEKIGPRVSNIE